MKCSCTLLLCNKEIFFHCLTKSVLKQYPLWCTLLKQNLNEYILNIRRKNLITGTWKKGGVNGIICMDIFLTEISLKCKYIKREKHLGYTPPV